MEELTAKEVYNLLNSIIERLKKHERFEFKKIFKVHHAHLLIKTEDIKKVDHMYSENWDPHRSSAFSKMEHFDPHIDIQVKEGALHIGLETDYGFLRHLKGVNNFYSFTIREDRLNHIKLDTTSLRFFPLDDLGVYFIWS